MEERWRVLQLNEKLEFKDESTCGYRSVKKKKKLRRDFKNNLKLEEKKFYVANVLFYL